MIMHLSVVTIYFYWDSPFTLQKAGSPAAGEVEKSHKERLQS